MAAGGSTSTGSTSTRAGESACPGRTTFTCATCEGWGWLTYACSKCADPECPDGDREPCEDCKGHGRV